MVTLKGIVPSTVVDQLRMIEEIAAAPVEEVRPLLAIVLTTFLVDRLDMELPHLYVDAIDAVLRRVRDQGRARLTTGGAEASPLLIAVQEHRQQIAEGQAAGTLAQEGEAVSETTYQPKPLSASA
jgi:hypothetical protein